MSRRQLRSIKSLPAEHVETVDELPYRSPTGNSNRYHLPDTTLDPPPGPDADIESAYKKLERYFFYSAAQSLTFVVRPYYERSRSLIKACRALMSLSPKDGTSLQALTQMADLISKAIQVASHLHIPSSAFTTADNVPMGASGIGDTPSATTPGPIDKANAAFTEAISSVSNYILANISAKAARQHPDLRRFDKRMGSQAIEDGKRGNMIGRHLREQVSQLAQSRRARLQQAYNDDWSTI